MKGVRVNKMDTLSIALAALIAEIKNGAEFPDAAHRAAVKYKVDQAALECSYDEFGQRYLSDIKACNH